MGSGPSLEEQMKADKEYIEFVQQRQKALTDTQGANYLNVISSVDALLNASVSETIEKEKDLEKVSKDQLDKAKASLTDANKQAKEDAAAGKQPTDAPKIELKNDGLQKVKNPAAGHRPAPGTLVLINTFDCVYTSENKITFSWLGDAINTLVQNLTGVATAVGKEGGGKEKGKEATESKDAKEIGSNLNAGSEDLLNTFSSVFSSVDSIAMISKGIASCLKSILASFDSVTQSSLHLNKTIRFIAPGAYIGVYVCDSTFSHTGAFKSTSFKLSCYGMYMATSLSLMKELEKLDTMRNVFRYYKEQLASFDKQSTEISSVLADCANVHKQIGKFKALRVSKLETNLKTEYLKKWLADIVEQIDEAVRCGDCDAKEGTEFYNSAVGDLRKNIQFLQDARADTFETMEKYVTQLEKLAKI